MTAEHICAGRGAGAPESAIRRRFLRDRAVGQRLATCAGCKNVSDDGLLLENPLADAFPGQHVELELPRQRGHPPLRVEGEIVYVTRRKVASGSA